MILFLEKLIFQGKASHPFSFSFTSLMRYGYSHKTLDELGGVDGGGGGAQNSKPSYPFVNLGRVDPF